MIKIIEFIRHNIHHIITALLFAIAAGLLVYFLPSEGRFMYEYQKGGFWKHEDLMAPFDFPINKSDKEIEQERDSVLSQFKPIFLYNRQLSETRISEIEEGFTSAWITYSLENLNIPSREAYLSENNYLSNKRLENEYKELLLATVREIYDAGIIDMAPIEMDGTPVYEEITVVRENVAEVHHISEYYTPKTAYEYLLTRIEDYNPRAGITITRRYREFFETFEINKFLSINVIYDDIKSRNVSRELVNGISLTKGLIQEGQGIISKGEYIDDDKYMILESLRQEYEQNLGFMARNLVVLGKLVLVLSCLLIIYLFLRNFRKEVLDSNTKITFILLSVVLVVLIASITIRYDLVSVYIIPFVILPIILNAFLDSRVSLFIHVIAMLMIGFFVPNGFEFVLLNIIAGMVSIVTISNLIRRSGIVITAVVVILVYSVLYTAFSLVQEGDISNIEVRYFRWFGLNGVLIMIAYPLIYLFEKTFGFVSDATLMELSDTNQPLLRKLAELAPGTFQHSLQVANLAEDAIHHIGGNPLLVRAGALYHDIGKMDNPLYFIENQSTGGINPHDNIEFEESASIIINHVKKGVELARKKNLPEAIIDFIQTHHGTNTVHYFYKSYINKYPQEEVDIIRFSYPGPKPFSKETAVVMMADSVEAASRSLKTVSGEALEKLVDSIIGSQMKEEQYNNSQITFKDITVIREVFKKRLSTIYHARISYPK